MKVITLLLFFVVIPLTQAGVNLKNGNYYISYTDIIVPGGGHDLEITRTYNSKSTDIGWFGFGWGSDFETFLVISADGSVVVHENGSGAQTRFVPKVPLDAVKAAAKVVAAMRKRAPMKPKVAAELVRKLSKDAELRQAYARKFGVKSKIAVGTWLYSNNRGLQKMKKISSGFVRVYNNGKQETFNSVGRLVNIKYKDNYSVQLNYEKTGLLSSIKDSQSKQLFFDWYQGGRVKAIWSTKDKKTAYKYQGKDLTESKDIGGNEYSYKYDKNHNLVQISYTDKSKMEVKYEPKTQFVSQITARNGEITEYEYGSNPKNPDLHYWTTVIKKGLTKKPIKNRYEYEIRTKPDGEQYTYKIATTINNVSTETIYSECCSLPVKITRGKHITDFEYNSKGLLVKKTSTKGDFVELKYHKEFNKITYVKNNKGWTKFEYNKKGDLSLAQNNKGQKVKLIYNTRSQIKSMIDMDKKKKKPRMLSFVYNAQGKPVEISIKGTGKINVSYDNYGEIKKVESKKGHKMALQVTKAFQALLSIVKPAGVNLSL